MKVWPIDPLVPRNLRLEVPEKLPQGLLRTVSPRPVHPTGSSPALAPPTVPRVARASRLGRPQGYTPGCGEVSSGLWYQASAGNSSVRMLAWDEQGNNPKDRDDPQSTRLPGLGQKPSDSTLAKVWARRHPTRLRYGLRSPERARPSIVPHGVEKWPRDPPLRGGSLVSRNWLVAAKRS